MASRLFASRIGVLPPSTILAKLGAPAARATRRISSSLVTFEFQPTAAGVDVVCTHQAAFYEGADGPQMRKGGWEKLLDALGDALVPA